MREIITRRVPTEYRPAGFHIVVRRIKAQNTDLVKATVPGATPICVHLRPPISSVVLSALIDTTLDKSYL